MQKIATEQRTKEWKSDSAGTATNSALPAKSSVAITGKSTGVVSRRKERTARQVYITAFIKTVFYAGGWWWLLHAMPHGFPMTILAQTALLVAFAIILLFLSDASAKAITPTVDSWITSFTRSMKKDR